MSLFAFTFPDRSSAEQGWHALKARAGGGALKLVASVVLTKSGEGELIQEHGERPGPLGAEIGAAVGALIGLLGGPGVAAFGGAAGAVSGGWFDANRAGERSEFLDAVAACLKSGRSDHSIERRRPHRAYSADERTWRRRLGTALQLKRVHCRRLLQGHSEKYTG